MNVNINISVPIYPAESPEKVEKAVLNIFPNMDIEIDNDSITGHGGFESLKHFHNLLRSQKILDTARSRLYNGIYGGWDSETADTLAITLNKQAAFMGKIGFIDNFSDSLGEITVEISAADIDADIYRFIDWLAPQTMDGEIVEEIRDDEL